MYPYFFEQCIFYNLHNVYSSLHPPFPLCSTCFLSLTFHFIHRILNTPLSFLYALLSNLTTLSFPSTVPIYPLLCCHCGIKSSICLSKKDPDRSWHMILHISFRTSHLTSNFILFFILLLSVTLNPPPSPWQFLLHHLAPLCLPLLSLAWRICVFECVIVILKVFTCELTWLFPWKRACAGVWTVSRR